MTTTEFQNGLTFVISQKSGSTVTNLYPITKLANVRYEDESGNIVDAASRIEAIETAAADLATTVSENKEACDSAMATEVAAREEADTALDERVTAIETNEAANESQLVPDYSEETVSSLRFLRNDNTWADIQEATTDQYGVTILSDAVDSDSSDTAATSAAVKKAYDYADTMIPQAQIGVANGIAPLDENALVPATHLPSYVDDVIEGTRVVSVETNSDGESVYVVKQFYDTDGALITPETGKVYVDTNVNISYRWSGTQYTVVASDLALGETHETAYYGDLGKVAYEYSQAVHLEESENNGYVVFDGVEYLVYTHPTSTSATNPHDTTAEDVGLGNVENIDGQTLVDTYLPTTSAVATSSANGAMTAEQVQTLEGLMNVYVQATEPEITDTTSDTILWFNTSES